MFYGGRLASHISGLDPTEIVEEFISLRKLNRRAVILIDSDKRFPQTALNKTKLRLIEEFDKGPGFAWVTAGRNIENYISPELLREALLNAAPSAKIMSDFARYSDCLEVETQKGSAATAPKVAVAKHVASQENLDLDLLDLKTQLGKLEEFIRTSNT